MPRMEGTTLHAILAPSKKSEPAPKKPATAPAKSESPSIAPTAAQA
jgi:translation initiation factor IF-3